MIVIGLADDVWCVACQHSHIGSIPVTTFRCADCGFGSWRDEEAEWHATTYPTHRVYPEVHSVVPYLPCGCLSHDPADHQGACGHCGANEDELCRPDCPVAGDDAEPMVVR